MPIIPEPKKLKNIKAIAGLGFFILLIVFAIYIFSNQNSDQNIKIAEKDTIAANGSIKDDKEIAYTMAQDFMKDHLLAPTSAKFQLYSSKLVEFDGIDKYIITFFVDSKNGYGTIERSSYKITLKNIGNSKWSLLDISSPR